MILIILVRIFYILLYTKLQLIRTFVDIYISLKISHLSDHADIQFIQIRQTEKKIGSGRSEHKVGRPTLNVTLHAHNTVINL